MKKIVALFFVSLFVFGFSGKESHASSTTYVVKPGDNLYRISLAYNTSVANIKSWNNLSNDLIVPNQKLVVGKQAVSNSTVSTSKPSASVSKPKGTVKKEFTMQSTAYTASCVGCSGITKTGINLKKNPYAKVVAVDPNVIPLGSKVYVEGYGEAIAGDIGGAIKGNKIDVFISNNGRALKWGRKTVKVQLLD